MFVNEAYNQTPFYPTVEQVPQYMGYQLKNKSALEIEPLLDLINQAQKISQAILNKNEPITRHSQKVDYCAQPVVFEQSRFQSGIGPIYIYNNAPRCEHRQRRSKNNEDPVAKDSRDPVAMGIGVLLMGIGGYLVYKASQALEALKKERAALECHSFYWNQYTVSHQRDLDYNRDFHEKLRVIVDRARSILQREQSEKLYQIALRVTMITAGVFLFLGGLVNSPELIAGGAVVGTGMMVFNGCRSIYKKLTQRSKRDAEVIRNTSMPDVTRPAPMTVFYMAVPPSAPLLYPNLDSQLTGMPYSGPILHPYPCGNFQPSAPPL